MLTHWLNLPFVAGKNLSIDFGHLCFIGMIGVGLATLAFRQQKEKIISAWKKEKQKILVWALGCLGFLIITAILLFVKFSSYFGFWGASKKATKSTNARRSTNWRYFPLSLD